MGWLIKGLYLLFLVGIFFNTVEGFAQTQFPPISLIGQVSGLIQPAHITHAGDGSGRLFVVEQIGRIRIIRNGVLLTTPFLDISGRLLSGGEQGLLSVAFPPGFVNKGYFYVNYTRAPDGATVVARYFITADPDVADPISEQIILTVAQPFANHNGGQLAFGPNGFLYIGMGDGGSGGDPFNNGQNPGTYLGKMLRIDVESLDCVPYCIPPNNPFVGNLLFLGEIWALGFRNPWRFSFDRLTGDLYVGDVGQNLFEEVDFQLASSLGGENYGWNIMEGLHCFNVLNFNSPLPVCNQGGLTLPVAEYDHTQGCSVTGGTVYRGQLHPRMQGIYFYGDFCTGRIWGLRRVGAIWQNTLLLDTLLSISSFGEDEAGELYVADYSLGSIYRMTVPETIGVFRPSNGTFFLKNQNSTGVADAAFVFGTAGDQPIKGDWNGDGVDTVGVVRGNAFFLRNSNSAGGADLSFFYGIPGDIPLAGDWTGKGFDSIGIYRPSNQKFYLRNSNSTGVAEIVAQYGLPGDIPIVGDWNGDGIDTIGVYRPSNQRFYLRNFNSTGIADIVAQYGLPGDIPIVGDWNGDGIDTIGVYRPSNQKFYLRNSNSTGVADVPAFVYGIPGDIPIVGNWGLP